MLWFIIHHIVQSLISGSDQTKNLITFLSGTVCYTLIYAYLGAMDYENHKFGKYLYNFFIYIIIADAIAIAIIYKNFYKETVLNEITEVIRGKDNIRNEILDNNNVSELIREKGNINYKFTINDDDTIDDK